MNREKDFSFVIKTDRITRHHPSATSGNFATNKIANIRRNSQRYYVIDWINFRDIFALLI